ncbi:ankyrin repeat and SOCS box protein 5b [Lampris incognitus]|uniref:ankyrin repeat and SOCS box protein 5b n=1 Tax=Lampris incognitus TaxID=2546036 RepID=UPI0024B4A747|nr:ankyrin repeat and SOCS box protein 5b [Lampris incognitus]
MPEVPVQSLDLTSRKRGLDLGYSAGSLPERKRACWGILTSQGSWADRSPLHEAASQGRLLALNTLLVQGYQANILTIDHVTPLHEACLSDRVACVRALLRAGANVNSATIDGVTPLYNCSSSGSVGCMELLLQNGARTHTTHAHLPSALHEACKRGHSQCVELLLAYGADPDYNASHLGSPLHVACLYNQTACCRILLHRGARVSVGRGVESPLHTAARQDSAEQVSLLLEYGADCNLRDERHQRAVDLATPGGRTEELLLENQASPRSLLLLCRILIRRVVGPSRLKLLPSLPLPPLLTDYLQAGPPGTPAAHVLLGAAGDAACP